MTRLTAVSAAMRRVVRRTPGVRKSSTGQSATALGSRRSFRRCSHIPDGISSSPRTKMAGSATKTTRPAYGLLSNPIDHGNHQRDEHHGADRGDHRADDRERMTGERGAARHVASATSGSACRRPARRGPPRAACSYFFGIGGFFVDFVLAAISIGLTIQLRMSSADSFVPTPSSGFVLLPLPAMAWHIEHFCAAYTCLPLLHLCGVLRTRDSDRTDQSDREQPHRRHERPAHGILHRRHRATVPVPYQK